MSNLKSKTIHRNYSDALDPISSAPKVGTVHEADGIGAFSVLLGDCLLPICGYLSPIPGIIPMLLPGQQVLVLETKQGVGILGCWQSSDENVKARIDIKNGHLQINATESIILKSGESSIEIRNDGKIRVDGKDIYNIAEGPLRLQGSIIELN